MQAEKTAEKTVEAQATRQFKVIQLTPLGNSTDLALPEQPVLLDEPKPSFWRRHLLFLLFFVLPVAAGSTYYGFIAADQYAVETSYVVRTLNSSMAINPLTILGQSQSFARSEEDTQAINVFMQSRDAAAQLGDLIRKDLGQSKVDIFARYPAPFMADTLEHLYEAFQRQITIKMEGSTGISTLEVRAYDPQHAFELSTRLLQLGEGLINKMNKRAQEDTVKVAREIVQDAEDKLRVQQMRMLAFRNREMILDPQAESVASYELLGQLMGRVAQEEANLGQIMATSPKSPQIASIQERIKAYKQEIERQRARVVGGKDSLANKLAEFEQITLERELATKTLASAMASLETARQEALRQQYYLETIVKPSMPDQARYPKRILSILVVMILSFCVYWIVRKSADLINEHQQ